MRICHLVMGVVLLVAGAVTARAATPEVRVVGTRAMSSERAQTVLLAGGFPSASGVHALQQAYYEEGRLFAACTVEQGADSAWTVWIDEGEPARLRRVRVAGASVRTTAELVQTLGLEPGSVFLPRRLARAIEGVLVDYDRAGYPFAQVWVDSVGIDADSAAVDIALFVVEGNPRDVNAVVVEGLTKTRPDRVTRIAGIETGVPYRAQALEDAYLRLSESGIFTEVMTPSVRLSADGTGVDAVLRVKEPERSHSLAAALGYASAEGETDRTLSGFAQLELANIGGTLKDFGVLWNNDGSGRNETRIRYQDRLFLGKRLGIEARLEQVGQDTLYTWQSAGLSVSRGLGRVGGVLVGTGVGGFGDRNVFSAGPLLRSSRWRARLTATALRGDERRGRFGRLELAATAAFKHNTYREGESGEADVQQFIYEAGLETLMPVWRSLHYALEGRLRWLDSDEDAVPLSEQFYLGGARTVRGYRENQFHGRRALWVRNEVRLGRSGREGFYLFLDAGSVQQETPLATGGAATERIGLTGFGFGVRSLSALGRIDLGFAVSDELSLQQTKVYVVLEQTF